MIIQLGAIIGGLGSGIVSTGLQTLLGRRRAARGLDPQEFSEIQVAQQRLGRVGERPVTTSDPFSATGGTLLFRESQLGIPGLVEQLSFEAAVRRESQRFVDSPEFLAFQTQVLRERETGFVPLQEDFQRTEVVLQGIAKEPIGPAMIPNRATKRAEGREVVQMPASTLAGPCAGATTAAARAACAAGGFV